MRKPQSAYLIILFFLLLILPAYSQVKLPAIFSSNMVLQRNSEVAIWGWANSGETITINASWLQQPVSVKADKDGTWRANLQTTNSKENQTLTLKSKSSEITLENILFGEVWLCSGQSNMQQPLNGYRGQPTFGALEAAISSKNSNLRLFTVSRLGSKEPLSDLEDFTPWQEASPNNVSTFSAIGYFFGEQLQKILDVPIGIIHTSYGGSTVEAWISNEVLTEFTPVDLEEVDITRGTQRIPTALFNSMLNPLIPYTIKGVLWYQGESNRLEPDNYKVRFPAMVKDWRARWNIGDFPFYFVQIAPFTYGDNSKFQSFENSAFIREAQLQCVDLIPNSGIAITMDIGEEFVIHPAKKKEVADRLLFNALNQTYGYENIDYAGPVYDSLELTEDGIVLSFKNAEMGLYSNGNLAGFEIAGSDKVFHEAEARIVRGSSVLVSNAEVPEPVAVRYAWKNWVVGTLYDTNLLPASSFRTDTWTDATRKEN